MQEISKEYEKIEKWLKNLLGEKFDTFDLRAEFDSSLNEQENKAQLREKIKVLLNDKDNLKEKMLEAKAAQERLINQIKNEAEREADEHNKSITYEGKTELESFYKQQYRSVSKLAQGFLKVMFVEGPRGFGKTYHNGQALVKNGLKAGVDYIEICGEVSEAYLYRLIFENNGKIIWLRDVNKILQNQGSLNLLKNATEMREHRILTKNNYSKDQADLPNRFECKSKFIFEFNNIAGPHKEDFDALTSRGDHIKLVFCVDEIYAIMKLIAKGEVKKEETTEYIIQQSEEFKVIKLNLRTQAKAFETREWAEKNGLDWKKEVSDELKQASKTRLMLYEIMGDRTMTSTELYKLLLRYEIVNTLRVCQLRVKDWIAMEELYQLDDRQRDFFVSINPRRKMVN